MAHPDAKTIKYLSFVLKLSYKYHAVRLPHTM